VLSNQDIEKLTRVLASKSDLADITRRLEGHEERLTSIETSLGGLTNALNGLSRSIFDLRLEYAAIMNQLSRHEISINRLSKSS
jgi:hypothetical protein